MGGDGPCELVPTAWFIDRGKHFNRPSRITFADADCTDRS
jgi:hypothetical protein